MNIEENDEIEIESNNFENSQNIQKTEEVNFIDTERYMNLEDNNNSIKNQSFEVHINNKNENFSVSEKKNQETLNVKEFSERGNENNNLLLDNINKFTTIKKTENLNSVDSACNNNNIKISFGNKDHYNNQDSNNNSYNNKINKQNFINFEDINSKKKSTKEKENIFIDNNSEDKYIMNSNIINYVDLENENNQYNNDYENYELDNEENNDNEYNNYNNSNLKLKQYKKCIKLFYRVERSVYTKDNT